MNFKKSLNRIISAALAGTLALTMVSFPPVSIKAASSKVKLEKDQKEYIVTNLNDFKAFLGDWQKWYNEVNGVVTEPDVPEKDPAKDTEPDQNGGSSDTGGNGQGGSGDSGTGNSDTDNSESGTGNTDPKPEGETSGNNGNSQNDNLNKEENKTSDVQNNGKENVQIIEKSDNKVAAPTETQPLEPVAILTHDIKIEISNDNPYTQPEIFSGEIRGEGHAIFTSVPLFKTLDNALLINIQICPGSFTGSGIQYSLAEKAVKGTTLVNCFSGDSQVRMIKSADSTCKFINCYSQVQSSANPETDEVGITYLPSSQMMTRAFAYIITHPVGVKDNPRLKDKVDAKFAFKQGSYPIPLQKTPSSTAYKPSEDPLEYKNKSFMISDSSDLLSLAMLTKLDMLNGLRDKNPIFKQTNDIKMSIEANAAFVQIGNADHPFNATYEGDGYMIQNLRIQGGIFGTMKGAKIYNLGIENATIKSNDNPNMNNRICTGILADVSDNCVIDRCYAVGTIDAGHTDTPPTGDIDEDNGKQIGGLLGFSYFNDISNCYTRAKITNNNIMFAGGFAGSDFHSDFKNIYSAGIYSRANRTGGLFGYLDEPSSVKNCYYDKNCDPGADKPNFTYESKSNKPVEVFSTPTDRMRTVIQADNLNSEPELEKPFGWHASRNDRYPILYGIGSGRGVTPPEMYKVKLKQPKGSEITMTYNGEEYKKDGTEILVPEGAEIQLSHKEEYTYKFKNYRAKINKKGDRRFDDNKLVITGDTEITADIDKNGVTVSFSYSDGGYVKYDSLLENSQQGVSNDSVTLEKGAQFEFEIVTDYGYRIKKVTYTAGTLHKISENKYRISRVSKDGTVKVEFEHIEKEELKEVVDDKTGDVVVKVNKQTDMIDQIAHNEGNKIQTEMGKATMLSGKVLNELYGEDVAIQLVMKDYRWDINGTTLTRTRNRNINMGVNIGQNKSTISDIATLQLENHEDIIPLNLVHRGDFPFTGYLTLNVGEEQQYRYASLFYYNPRSRVFEFQECNDVAENGDLTYRFTHASDYVIVIENEPIWDLAAGEGMAETEMPVL